MVFACPLANDLFRAERTLRKRCKDAFKYSRHTQGLLLHNEQAWTTAFRAVSVPFIVSPPTNRNPHKTHTRPDINECVTRRTLTTSFAVISMSVAKRNLKIFPLIIAQLMEISPSGRNDETRDVVRWL